MGDRIERAQIEMDRNTENSIKYDITSRLGTIRVQKSEIKEHQETIDNAEKEIKELNEISLADYRESKNWKKNATNDCTDALTNAVHFGIPVEGFKSGGVWVDESSEVTKKDFDAVIKDNGKCRDSFIVSTQHGKPHYDKYINCNWIE